MDQLQTSVLLMTTTHCSTGQIVNAGQRLHDIINNRLSTCLTLYDVAVCRPQQPTTPIVRLSEVTVPKDQINLLIVPEQRHEAPTNRLYSYVQKSVYHTFLTVDGYEVQGRLHFTAFQKPEAFLSDAMTSFIPLSHATVTSIEAEVPPWQAGVAFVRRCAIALFHVGESA